MAVTKPEPMHHANALPSAPAPLVKWFEQHGNAATAVACVAMIGGAIWFSYHRTTTARSESAWAQYSQARTAEDFANLADVYERTDVGAWARLSAAERYLDSGLSLMFTDRKAGLGDLEAADKAFRQVLDSRSATQIARERALWGLARSTETQSDGDTTKAIEAYSALLKQFPKSDYKSAAEGRIEALKSDSVKEFYAWFRKQNPKPPDPKKPQDGLPAGHPPIGTSKDEPPFDTEKPADGEKPAPPKLTIPLDPDDEKPAAKKKDDKPPATEPEKPSEKSKDDQSSAVIDNLKTELDVNFSRMPLQDAFQFIAEKCDVEIEINGDALKSAGFTKNMPQTLDLGKVTGLDAIASILKRYEKEKVPMVLVVDEAQKKAVITTTEFAEKSELKPFVFPAKSNDKPGEPKPEQKPEPKGESKDAPAENK